MPDSDSEIANIGNETTLEQDVQQVLSFYDSEISSTEGGLRESQLKMQELARDYQGEPGMKVLGVDYSNELDVLEERLLQMRRGRDAVERGDTIDVLIGKERMISELSYGRPASIQGFYEQREGKPFEIKVNLIFVKDSTSAGKVVNINQVEYTTITPETPIGRKIILDSLNREGSIR